MEKFAFAVTTYIKSMGGDGWIGVGVQKRGLKNHFIIVHAYSSDRYAVAVKNEGTIIEHLPRKLSQVCSLFLRRGSTQSQV